MTDVPPSNRRAHFRLSYPPAERPSIRIDGRAFAVTELSEGGARMLLEDLHVPVGKPVVGTLVFKDREQVDVEGRVLRIQDRETIVQFSRGVSMKRMLAEQILVKRKYPGFFDPAK